MHVAAAGFAAGSADEVGRMASGATAATAGADGAEAAGGGGGAGKRKLILLSVPVVLVAAGAGAWFSGLLPGLLGIGGAAEEAASSPAPKRGVFAMPDIIVNLSVPAGRRPSYLKVSIRLEIADERDLPHVQANLARLQDLFTTYLRELRPEELRGSAGTHRLREELMARATIAVAPAQVTDVLFVEMLVQ
ncbi:MAG: flagellar basal body-associated FliL family protein [Elioraea sp.]|nr:flagellar basal body-associated FliL family protein [Elioraea sp.]